MTVEILSPTADLPLTRSRSGRWKWVGRLAGIALLAALVGVPVVRLATVAMENHGAGFRGLTGRSGLGAAVWHSVLLAVAVPVFSVVLGTTAALWLRHPMPGRRTLSALLLLPLVVPQFVLGYSWTQAYGRAGFTDHLVGLEWDRLTGGPGVVVVSVVDAVPMVFLLVTAGLATRARPDLEWAARTSGASTWTVTRTVTLPLLRPVLAAATVLVGISAAESFAVPQVLGTPGGFATVTTRIYADLSLASSAEAFEESVGLALVLAAAVLLVAIPADRWLLPQVLAGGDETTASTPPASMPRRGWWRSALLSGYVFWAIAVPLLALASAAITRAVGLPPTPANWTLRNFADAWSPPIVAALEHSVMLAAAAATLLVLVGSIVALRQRHRRGRIAGSMSLITYALPGSTLAIGLLLGYGRTIGSGLALILLAYLAKFWALALRALSGGAQRIPDRELDAAHVSGAGWLATARTVWFPALAPVVLGAWLLIFVAGLHEVTMSSLLYSFDNQTLAVAVLNAQESGGVGQTAALSLILTILLLACAVPAALLLRGRGRRAH